MNWNWKVTAIIAIIPLLLVLGYVLKLFNGEDSMPEPVQVEAPAESVSSIIRDDYEPPASASYDNETYVEEEPLVAPPSSLEDSDKQVREAVLDLAPTMASWLLPEEQIRKWVLMIDLMAEGKLPRQYRPINYPMALFKVDEDSGVLVADPVNYDRANLLLDQLIAIEPARLARYYREWQPLLEKAYRELGKPGSFDQRLRGAIDRVLAVKPLQQQADLKRPGVFYQYDNPMLEKSSDLNRLMWRLGEANTQRLQAYLKKLSAEL